MIQDKRSRISEIVKNSQIQKIANKTQITISKNTKKKKSENECENLMQNTNNLTEESVEIERKFQK